VPVTIDFRGVMLFRCSRADGTLEQILLPNAEEDSSWPENKKHPDGSDARIHYAGLVLEPKGSIKAQFIPLKDTNVEVVFEEATSDPSVSISGLPMLRPATYGKGIVDPELAATRIWVKGGTLTSHPPLPTKVKSKGFVNRPVNHHGARLTSNQTASVVVRNRSGDVLDSLTIKQGDKAAVYNYEVRYPSIHDLNYVGHCEPNEMLHDPDFIWLYSLLRDWDKDVNDHPAPSVRCVGGNDYDAKVITVFTCFPAVWENDESRLEMFSGAKASKAQSGPTSGGKSTGPSPKRGRKEK
jgi:hypothetical protein